MGEVHNWEHCRCQLCLTRQTLLLLAYNERLGQDFNQTCVRKLRAVYLELLDEAESRSREGVGRGDSSVKQEHKRSTARREILSRIQVIR